jgi:poly-gamma-glutamate capsule biosynthesis protein CapA/YwtB (metallophosphatase superfamily)
VLRSLLLGFAVLVALAVVTVAAPSRSEAVTLAAVGDMAMAPAADGGSGFFSGVGRELTGDIVLGNLEGTLASGGSSKCGPQSTDCFAFRAPPKYAQTLRRAGFTILNLANNHALDFGTSGQAETVSALDGAGLRHTGRPGEVAVIRTEGIRVAVLGFAPYPWAQDLRDIPAAVRIVRKADRKADVVVVTMHAGAEGADHQHVRPGTETFLGENRGNPVAFAHAVVNAGADLVVGHGPHVLRGLEWYHGRLIAYSLGNFLGNGTLSIAGPSGVSAVLHVRLTRTGSWAGGRLAAIRLVSPGVPRRDTSDAALGTVRDLSRADFGSRAMRIAPSGTLVRPG